jgi:hemerythrin-like metal-binding protein
MNSIRPTKIFDDVLALMGTEHQQLSEAIARIKSAIASQDLSVVRLELLQLQSSEQAHFHHEEEMMQRYDYPDIVSHKEVHKVMADTLSSIVRNVVIDKLHDISDDLGNYLEKALSQILEHDNDLRDFLLARRKNTS